MSTAINKTANSEGIYRYLRNIEISAFPTSTWLIDPDISALVSVDEQYWKVIPGGSPNTFQVVEMTQVEKDAVDAALIEAESEINTYGEFIFGNADATSNRWLRTYGFNMPSDKMPTIFFNEGVLTGLKFLAHTDNADTDVELYLNDVLWYTWSIRGMRYAYKTNNLSTLVFSQGDKLSVRLGKAGTTTPMHPIVMIQYRHNLRLTGEGGSATL